MLTVATISAFFIPAALALSDAEREAQVVELQQEAMDATARIDPSSARPRLEPRQEPGDGDRDGDGRIDQQHDYARYDSTGRRVWGNGPDRADAPVLAALAGRSTTGRVGDERVAAVPLADGGAVRAAEPAAEADRRTRTAVLQLAAIAGLVLALGAGAAWLLARRLTEPLRQLGLSAVRLGGGDFTATAPRAGIIEIDAVAEALDAGATRIGQLVERERRLTADTSHQMRTPITGLRVALETELAAPRPDPRAILGEALGAVDRLDATVTALTDLARGESTGEPFDLDAMLQAALERWQPPYRSAGRGLRSGPASGGFSPARQAAVDTILDVLLENALTHGRGDVEVEVTGSAGVARVTVTDEGRCTIEGSELFRRHASGGGGSGIGLHLARTLAEAEGARLRLISRGPTTFELQLPAHHAGPGRPTPDRDGSGQP